MPSTMLLDGVEWDLVLDADGNIAAATAPYAAAQDAASAIRTFEGEVYWDTQLGVPYRSKILGKNPPLALLKAMLQDAALETEGVRTARCVITALTERMLEGQVQVTSTVNGQAAAVSFAVQNPQV